MNRRQFFLALPVVAVVRVPGRNRMFPVQLIDNPCLPPIIPKWYLRHAEMMRETFDEMSSDNLFLLHED